MACPPMSPMTLLGRITGYALVRGATPGPPGTTDLP